MKRREVIKGLTCLPLVGGTIGSMESIFGVPSNERLSFIKEMSLKSTSVPGPLTPGPQIYQSIGVDPIINCRGTLTMIGGSVELPEVRKAMEYACLYNVQIDELALAVGQRLSEITGADWGMVSSGCAAGMKLVTIGCLTGGNPEKLIRIPDLTGFEKTEVIIPRSSRNFYDHAIRNTGVTVITVDTFEDLEKAINPKTAMIYVMTGRDTETGREFAIEKIAALANPKNITFLVDAAAERLTIPNVHLVKGATVVAYSGGKVIRGPQGAGLMLGKKDVLQAAWQSGSPHHGPGRDNKVGREEHIGMLAAVEAWAVRDHAAEMRMWVSWMDNIAKRVSGIKDIKTEVTKPSPEALGNASPRLTITWDPLKLHITGAEVADELAHTKPRIALSTGRRSNNSENAGLTSISLSGYMMQPDEVNIVGNRIYEILTRKHNQKSITEMQSPANDISGRWDLTLDFYTSKSEHKFYIEKQNGNWIQGTHKGDFASRELFGTIDGNQVKFNSVFSMPGNSINYTFWGTVSGDIMSGDIHMGEYLTCKFTAKRYSYPNSQMEIVIPNGPPLGN